MAKSLHEWVATDVEQVKHKPLSWLSQYHFFRDPTRAVCSDTSYLFAPADGIILYQKVVEPHECIVDIKGQPHSLRDAMRDQAYDKTSLVIAIFMTFFDVHINRIPFPGRLSYRPLEPIESFNRPMLEVERSILDDLRVPPGGADYLHSNQRMLNRIDSPQLGERYYILQIADYDVDSIMPFQLKQNHPCYQGQRFSQIRYGSQVDLILPLSEHFDFVPTQEVATHVEAGIDTLVAIRPRTTRAQDGRDDDALRG